LHDKLIGKPHAGAKPKKGGHVGRVNVGGVRQLRGKNKEVAKVGKIRLEGWALSHARNFTIQSRGDRKGRKNHIKKNSSKRPGESRGLPRLQGEKKRRHFERGANPGRTTLYSNGPRTCHMERERKPLRVKEKTRKRARKRGEFVKKG